MSAVNNVSLVGTITAEPKWIGFKNNGGKYSLRIMTEDRYRNQEGETKKITDYHNVDLYGREATNIGPYLAKGMMVSIQGPLKNESWEKDGKKNYRTYVRAESILRVGRGSANASAPQPQAQTAAPAPPPQPQQPLPGQQHLYGTPPPANNGGDDFDDLPF